MEGAEDPGVQDGAPRGVSSVAGPELFQHSTGSGLSRAGPDQPLHDMPGTYIDLSYEY